MDNDHLLGYDFYYIWTAGRITLEGGDPYQINSFAGQLTALGWPASEGVQGLSHPPNALWLYALISLVPFEVAKLLWLVLQTAILLWACSWTHRNQAWNWAKPSALLLSFAVLIFPPTILNLVFGQVNTVILASLIVFLRFFSQGRFLQSGLALSLSLFKPQLFYLVYLYLALDSIKNSSTRQVLLGLAIGFVSQIFATSMFSSSAVFGYGQGLIHTSQYHLYGASLVQSLATLLDLELIRLLGIAAGCAIALSIYVRDGFTMPILIRVMLPLSLLTSPYLWSHSIIVLLLSYARIVEILYLKFGERVKYLFICLALLGCYTNLRPSLEPIWIPFILLCLLLGYRERNYALA